jgi:F0F1-type ATP synthase assembly protein I
MSEPIENKKISNQGAASHTTMTPPTPSSGGTSKGLSLLAEVSTLSWNLVIPIVGGVLLGTYLDKRTGSDLTWTLSLLVLGILISFGNLYNLYMEHGSQAKQNHSEEVTDDQEK